MIWFKVDRATDFVFKIWFLKLAKVKHKVKRLNAKQNKYHGWIWKDINILFSFSELLFSNCVCVLCIVSLQSVAGCDVRVTDWKSIEENGDQIGVK